MACGGHPWRCCCFCCCDGEQKEPWLDSLCVHLHLHGVTTLHALVRAHAWRVVCAPGDGGGGGGEQEEWWLDSSALRPLVPARGRNRGGLLSDVEEDYVLQVNLATPEPLRALDPQPRNLQA